MTFHVLYYFVHILPVTAGRGNTKNKVVPNHRKLEYKRRLNIYYGKEEDSAKWSRHIKP